MSRSIAIGARQGAIQQQHGATKSALANGSASRIAAPSGETKLGPQPRLTGSTTQARAGRTSPDMVELRFAILSSEYSHLTSRLASTWSTSAERTNLFFVAGSGAGVALAFIANASHFSSAFSVLSLGVLLLVLLMGITALSRLLAANRESIRLIQSLNRIRHFFVDLDPGSNIYLTLSIHDDERGLFGTIKPRSGFGVMTQMPAASMATLVALVNSFVTAAIVSMVFLVATHSDLVIGLVVAGLTFVVATVLYEGWVFIDLGRLQQGLDVRFPSQ